MPGGLPRIRSFGNYSCGGRISSIVPRFLDVAISVPSLYPTDWDFLFTKCTQAHKLRSNQSISRTQLPSIAWATVTGTVTGVDGAPFQGDLRYGITHACQALDYGARDFPAIIFNTDNTFKTNLLLVAIERES
jgi:hypothetical protein